MKLLVSDKIEVFAIGDSIEPEYCKKEGHTLQWVHSNGEVYCEDCEKDNVILL